MIRRPPRSTRTDTLFPYTTLFRSGVVQPAGSFFAYPGASELITLDADETPRFWVTFDTEEDFDWDAPFARTGYRLASVPALAHCQGSFERADIGRASCMETVCPSV